MPHARFVSKTIDEKEMDGRIIIAKNKFQASIPQKEEE